MLHSECYISNWYLKITFQNVQHFFLLHFCQKITLFVHFNGYKECPK